MSVRPYFAFIDESGVLSNDPNQPFFAIGMLMMQDTSRLHHDLVNIRSKAIADTGYSGKSFEFKHNLVTRKSRKCYEAIIDSVFSYPDTSVSIFVVDKAHPDINIATDFPSTWDAYVSYSKIIIQAEIQRIESGATCIPLLDYISKPRNSTRWLESELNQLQVVENATMLESNSALLIQAIDIITGAVLYRYRMSRKLSACDKEKEAISNRLESLLNVKGLVGDCSVSRPIRFHIHEHRP